LKIFKNNNLINQKSGQKRHRQLQTHGQKHKQKSKQALTPIGLEEFQKSFDYIWDRYFILLQRRQFEFYCLFSKTNPPTVVNSSPVMRSVLRATTMYLPGGKSIGWYFEEI